MIRALLAGLTLVASQASSAPAQTAPGLARFSLTIESSPTGWAARCDSGCRWQRLSFDCARSCGAVIDASGVSTLATPRPDSAAFGFAVEYITNGVRATARAGTAWKTLTWSCDAASCAAHVDQSGVSEIRRTR